MVNKVLRAPGSRPEASAVTVARKAKLGARAQKKKDKELWSALESGDLAELSKAVEEGANLSSKGETKAGRQGWSSPLFWAVINGEARICEWLTLKGADMEKESPGESVALHFAALHGQLECCLALLAAGARVDRENRDGFTPAQLARNEELGRGYDFGKRALCAGAIEAAIEARELKASCEPSALAPRERALRPSRGSL